MITFDLEQYKFFCSLRKYFGFARYTISRNLTNFHWDFYTSGHIDEDLWKCWIDYFVDIYSITGFNELGYYYNKIYKTLSNRKYRVKKRIENMFLKKQDNLIFGTLTISPDNYIEDTSLFKKKYHRIVKKYLNDICNDWICNLDFGDDKARKHYHFIGFVNDMDILNKNERIRDKLAYEIDNWSYGFASCKIIIQDDKSSKKISRYVTKLSSHALKESTNPLNNKIMYSRKKKNTEL